METRSGDDDGGFKPNYRVNNLIKLPVATDADIEQAQDDYIKELERKSALKRDIEARGGTAIDEEQRKREAGAYTRATYADGTPIITGMPEFIFPGVCMTDIATTTGLTLGGVSRIFNGDRKPRIFTLRALAALYTDGDVEQLKAVIRVRVLRRLSRGKFSMEERNKILERIS